MVERVVSIGSTKTATRPARENHLGLALAFDRRMISPSAAPIQNVFTRDKYHLESVNADPPYLPLVDLSDDHQTHETPSGQHQRQCRRLHRCHCPARHRCLSASRHRPARCRTCRYRCRRRVPQVGEQARPGLLCPAADRALAGPSHLHHHHLHHRRQIQISPVSRPHYSRRVPATNSSPQALP